MKYSKINPEFKVKWIIALRSGDYDQHRGESNDAVTHNRHHMDKKLDVSARCCINVGAHVLLGSEADHLVTGESAEAIGLDWNTELKLVSLNDRGKMAFPEIADWVEENL